MMIRTLSYLSLASILVVGCGEEAPEERPAIFTNMSEMIPGPMLATVIEGVGYEALGTATKEVCANGFKCQVWVFPDGAVLPDVHPTSAVEYDQLEIMHKDRLVAIFKADRNSGITELWADCSVIADTPENYCL